METPQRKALRNVHANTQQISIPPSPFMKSLGYGTGVNVYRMERSPAIGQIRSPWAVKRVSQRIRETNKEDSNLFNERIIKEAEILRNLKHPNIIGFRAVTQEGDGIDSLVLECCSTSLGALLEERFENNSGVLPANNTKKMIFDISSALDYLHTKAKLLHGDLKSHNILVKGEFEICKLCDFGVSLPLDSNGQVNFQENPNLQYVGTVLWSAPEIVYEEPVIDSKADIFSFGLIIYETIALLPPHFTAVDDTFESENTSSQNVSCDSQDEKSISISSTTNPQNSKSYNESNDGDIVAYGTRPALPQAYEMQDEYNIIIELFYLCTNEEPCDRPAAKVILDSMNEQLKD